MRAHERHRPSPPCTNLHAFWWPPPPRPACVLNVCPLSGSNGNFRLIIFYSKISAPNFSSFSKLKISTQKNFSSEFQLIFRAENFDSKNFSSEFQLRNFESKISAWKRSWNSKLKISTRNGISTRRWIDPVGCQPLQYECLIYRPQIEKLNVLGEVLNCRKQSVLNQ